MKTTYTIEGMTCGGCARSVERALMAALPTTQIEVSLDKGQVDVNGVHDASAVKSAVQDAGFDYLGPA